MELFRRAKKLTVIGAVAVSLAVVLSVSAEVSPASVELTMKQGESETITKTVGVPEVPPKLDLVLDVDLSGSYFDDIDTIKSKKSDIFNGIRAAVPDSQFGLVTYVDYPYQPWGFAGSGDYAYSRDQDLTADQALWEGAVDAMVTRSGFDEPESQLESLYQAATGAGRDVGDVGPSLGDIDPGGAPSFRADATKVIAITTDASMHTAGDSECFDPAPCPFPYPGPTFADTVAALNAAGIKVVAIKAPGSTTQMDDLAAATGGAVVTTDTESSQIVEAIVGAIEELTFDITGNPVGCEPLDITFEPASHSDVSGGDTVNFEETITVPEDAEPQVVSCTVEFLADSTVIGTQQVTVTIEPNAITVPIDVKPTSCPNPLQLKSGNSVLPVAIVGTSGLDVTQIDASSVRLEGVAPLRSSLEDVATPFVGELADRNSCTTAGADGTLDLSLKFDRNAIVAAIGPVAEGDEVVLQLTGQLLDGTPIVGEDIVWIRK